MVADSTGLPLVHRPVGDLAQAVLAARIALETWGLDVEPKLLRLSMNATFRCGEFVLRVGHPTCANAPRRLAEALSDAGLRVPEVADLDPVTVGDLTTVAYRHVASASPTIDWVEVGRMIRQLHDRVRPEQLSAEVPIADPRCFPWWRFGEVLSSIQDSPLMTRPATDALTAEIRRSERWWDLLGRDPVICHGDLHPGNVIQSTDGPVLLDWDLLSFASRSWDHGPLLGQAIGPWPLERSAYDCFAIGYGEDLSNDADARTFARLRDLAATLMRVRAAMVDTAQAAEAELRVAYWVDGTSQRPWSPV